MHLRVTASEIERGRRAKRMTHRVEPRLQCYQLRPEPSGQSDQRPIGGGSRVRDIGPAFALSVAGIIDEQEGIARDLIPRRERQPIERERAVAAEGYPDSIGHTGPNVRGNVERSLLASARFELQL